MAEEPARKRQRVVSEDGADEKSGHFTEAFTDPAIDNVRIKEIKALAHPQLVMEEYALTDVGAETVQKGRAEISACVSGADDRIIVIVGPCSIHDPRSALEYAKRLKGERDRLEKDLVIAMRVYFEKPRTTVGWKGLINDPFLNDTYDINTGLRMGRRLLRDISDLGLPAACEFLDVIMPQYIGDLVSWAAIGARTTECQTHRELASGLSMPVGFKNGTSGDVDIAVDAVLAAQHPHCFFSITKQGTAAIVHSKGNTSTHVVLRGGKTGPNYQEVPEITGKLDKKGLAQGVMVDCSHANSQKNHKNQPVVCRDLAQQIRNGARICGVMIESHLFEGRQDLPVPTALTATARARPRLDPLGAGSLESPVLQAGMIRYGVSITDACVDWGTTVEMLDNLAQCVRDRRAEKKGNGKA